MVQKTFNGSFAKMLYNEVVMQIGVEKISEDFLLRDLF